MNISEIKARKRKDRDTWEYTFHVDGKRYRRSGFKTKADALRKAHAHVDEVTNEHTTNTEITFKKYYTDWIELYKKDELSKGQYYWYKRSLELFIEYFNEDKLVKNITKTDYQKLLNWYGKGRTKSSLEKLHVCISQVLKEAYHEGILKSDPTFKAKLNYTKAAKKEEEKYLKLNDYIRLIDYFKSRQEKSYLLLFVLAITGGRFSEVNRMTYDDLNIDSIHLPGTKTESAERDVKLPVKDIQLIKEKISRLPLNINGKIFKITNASANKALKKALDKLNAKDEEYITTHGLRHTHTSYLLSEGIPIEYISKRLGHKSITITLEVYSHLLEESKEKHDEKLLKIL